MLLKLGKALSETILTLIPTQRNVNNTELKSLFL